MYALDEVDVKRIQTLMASRYQGETLEYMTKRLSRYYTAEQLDWMLDHPRNQGAILIYEPKPRIGKDLQENLGDLADIILVRNRNALDSVCEAEIHRVRFVLVAALTKCSKTPDFNRQEITMLRARFPGFVVAHLPKKPSRELAFLLGKTDCSGWLDPSQNIHDEVERMLKLQNDVQEIIIYPDWVGLVCAYLSLDRIKGMDWVNSLACFISQQQTLTTAPHT